MAETDSPTFKNLVVLMLENRSFDSVLGWLYDDDPPARNQQFDGLHPDFWNPLGADDEVEKIFVKKGCHSKAGFFTPDPNPHEGFEATNAQLFSNYSTMGCPFEWLNKGFVNSYTTKTGTVGDPRDIMSCYTPEQLPVINTLAREYAVCDAWFGSVPSQTLPNRHFTHAGTSKGTVDNLPNYFCDAPTIFNHMEDLEKSGARPDLSWRVYAGTPKSDFTDPPDIGPSNAEYLSLTRAAMPKLYDRSLDHGFSSIEGFFQDVENGELPSYAFVEPHFFKGAGQNDQHPPTDIRAGENLIAEVYNALIKCEQWQDILFLITYDEHGGCYDHVQPPTAVPPDKDNPAGQHGFHFDRLGVRVPTVAVSPRIERGTIFRSGCDVAFDHTSILATLRERFDLGEPLTQRDAIAPTFSNLLTLSEERTDAKAIDPHAEIGYNECENHIEELLEGMLSEMTGEARSQGQTTQDFLMSAYAKKFS